VDYELTDLGRPIAQSIRDLIDTINRQLPGIVAYPVTVAIDAITDRSADAHTQTVAGVLPALGQSGTAAEVIALLG
jgi:hypothetical protein